MIVSWMTTARCNLKCRHCYQDAGEKRADELNTEEAKRLIDGIIKAGFKVMIFSGGEPLMREDIFELLRYAADGGLRPVLGTNGTLLNEETVLRIKESGGAAAGISLDSLDPARHDRFRGAENSFDLTLEGIRNFRKAGLRFQIHTTVMDWNRDEIEDIIDFAAAEGAASVHLFFLVPVGRGAQIEDTAVERNAYEQLLRRIMTKQKESSIPIKPTCAPQYTRVAAQLGVPLEKRFSKGCLAGLSYCVVSPSGKVRPCAYMTREAGDVREEPFDRIWADSSLFRLLRTQDYGGSCGTCLYKDVCGGCRARAAYYHGGDVLAEDSCCVYGRAAAEKPADRNIK